MSITLRHLRVLSVAILLTSALWSLPRGVIGQAPIPTATRTPTPINVGNFVWDDLDQDGRQDAGEPGLAGITVQLWNSAKTQLIDSAVTNASGIYSLVAPVPGGYRVRVVLPSIGDQFSPKDNAAAGDTLDSDINPSGTSLGFTDIYTFASNLISITSIDAGLIVFRTPTPTRTPTPINVGNFVWDDLDQDGRQDAGEPGLPGITVQLWNSAKTQLIDSAVTSASGNYSLVAPVPGGYRVRVVLPSIGDQFSPKDNAAAGDTLDSDINPSGTSLGFTDIYTFASNVISITSIDAGLIDLPDAHADAYPDADQCGQFRVARFGWRRAAGSGRAGAGGNHGSALEQHQDAAHRHGRHQRFGQLQPGGAGAGRLPCARRAAVCRRSVLAEG